VEWDGLVVGVMFPDSFMDDVTYVKNFEVWVECMILTYQGEFAMALRILYLVVFLMKMWDLLAQPHSSIS
jgi:hypothetical protein